MFILHVFILTQLKCCVPFCEFFSSNYHECIQEPVSQNPTVCALDAEIIYLPAVAPCQTVAHPSWSISDTLSPPFLLLSGDGGLQNKNALRSSIADSRDSWDSTFPLHHLAWLWSSRVSCLLPELPVQGARVGLSECRPRAGGGALQRWHRTLRDLLSSWHLPLTGSYEALWQRNEWIS